MLKTVEPLIEDGTLLPQGRTREWSTRELKGCLAPDKGNFLTGTLWTEVIGKIMAMQGQQVGDDDPVAVGWVQRARRLKEIRDLEGEEPSLARECALIAAAPGGLIDLESDNGKALHRSSRLYDGGKAVVTAQRGLADYKVCVPSTPR